MVYPVGSFPAPSRLRENRERKWEEKICGNNFRSNCHLTQIPESSPAAVNHELVPVRTVADHSCQNPHSHIIQTARANHRLLHVWKGKSKLLEEECEEGPKVVHTANRGDTITHHRKRNCQGAPHWAAPCPPLGDCRKGWSLCSTYRWCQERLVCPQSKTRKRTEVHV